MRSLGMVINSAKAWIIPHLGHIEVSRLTRVKIENWLDAMGNSPKKLKPRIGDGELRYAPPPKTNDEKRARKTDKEAQERKWIKTNQIRLLNEAYQKAGIEKVTFHELRHTYASTLVNRGCSLYVVAQQLGHTGTGMVEKHYGHLSPNTVRDEVMRTMPVLEI